MSLFSLFKDTKTSVTFTNQVTHMSFVYYLRDEKLSTILEVFEKFKEHVELHFYSKEYKIKAIRMGDGSEYQATLRAFLIEKRIESDITTHYSRNPTGFLNVSTEHFSIWPVLCCLEPIYQANSGRRQFLLLFISRTDFLTLAFVGILLLMRCGSELSRPYLTFVFSAVLLTFTSLKNIAKDMPMVKSAIVLSTHISSDTTNRTSFTKSDIRRTIPLFAQDTSSSTKSCIIRTKAISTNLS